MGSYIRQNKGALSLSAGLHIALVVALAFRLDFSAEPLYPPPSQEMVIQATVVDLAQIEEEMQRLEEQEQAELQRQQEQERLAREQAEEARREAAAEQQRLEDLRLEREQEEERETLRLAEVERQREIDERLEAEAQAQEERDREAEAQRQRAEEERLVREREAEEQRQREEQERLAREEEERRQREEQERLVREAEARQRAEMEAELQRVLAQEDERRRAEEAGLLDEYIRLIVNRIEQNWIRPASAQPGLECAVRVTQIPSGDIVDVRIGRCNGDDAVIRSIEAAVLRSSPLPRPPTPSLFERTLNVVFTPDV